MLKYLLKRLGVSVATLLVIVSISFFMIRVAPGGPFASTRKAPPEVVVNLNKVYHLDEPLYEQFGRYLWGAAHLDFGPSFKYRDYTVWELISRGFPVSLRLGLWGLFFAVIGGVLLGTWAAMRQNSFIDYFAMTVGMAGVAIPSYIMAAVYQMFFGILLGWLPVGGWDGSWSHMVLPVLVMALPGIADIARLTRGSMIDSLHSNHVRTARAKGMGQRLTVFRHALIGGLMPLVAYLGPATAGIVTGSVVVERAFSIPGIGRYFVEAASNRDYTMVMGTVIFYGMLIILANLAVDLIYALVDPKVRYE